MEGYRRVTPISDGEAADLQRLEEAAEANESKIGQK
jgi:hypothetical protein